MTIAIVLFLIGFGSAAFLLRRTPTPPDIYPSAVALGSNPSKQAVEEYAKTRD